MTVLCLFLRLLPFLPTLSDERKLFIKVYSILWPIIARRWKRPGKFLLCMRLQPHKRPTFIQRKVDHNLLFDFVYCLVLAGDFGVRRHFPHPCYLWNIGPALAVFRKSVATLPTPKMWYIYADYLLNRLTHYNSLLSEGSEQGKKRSSLVNSLGPPPHFCD